MQWRQEVKTRPLQNLTKNRGRENETEQRRFTCNFLFFFLFFLSVELFERRVKGREVRETGQGQRTSHLLGRTAGRRASLVTF